MSIIQEISEKMQKGRAKEVKLLVQQALDEGIDAKIILDEGLLSGMMLKGAGLDVCDLGVDVEPAEFIAKAEEIGADVIGMSALLTTTMPNMKGVVELLEEKGLREKYIIMVGGAPVNESFAEEVGADYYTPDAATAAEVAKKAIVEKA